MAWQINSTSLSNKDLLIEESLFSLANGYLGVRGNFEEGYKNEFSTIRGTYINAFHDIIDIPYGEKLFAFPDTAQKLLNLIDAQTIKIVLLTDGVEEEFSLFSGEVINYERTLYLDKGYSERRIYWRSPAGKELKIIFKRLVSFTTKELFLQEVDLEPLNFTGEVKILSVVNGDVENYVDKSDPRVASGEGKRLKVVECKVNEPYSYIEVETYRSKLRAGCLTEEKLTANYKLRENITSEYKESIYQFTLNEKTTFTKLNIYVDTLRHGNNLEQIAYELIKGLTNKNFREIANVQADYLAIFWQNSDVEIKTDEKLQEGIRFNLFHLLQAAGRDQFSNIAAKGLSGEGYEGHYFWDTEIYMFPFFLLTNPELAKNLLLYRYNILNSARERAKELGHRKGALFPWRTIAGSECSSFFPAGTAQYHISADIAYSYVQYYLATNDWEFMKKHGAEILFETARLWVDMGHYYQGSFRIDGVTGPDEYTAVVNNNYFTNVMAKYNLEWAHKIFFLLKEKEEAYLQSLRERLQLSLEEVSEWEKASKLIYLPYDRDLNINPQDDTFLKKAVWDFANTPNDKYPLLLHYHPLTLYRYQVCKQADTVLAHFLREDEQDFSVIKNSYDYYEKITTHDSSLSSCIFSIMAAKVGYLSKSYEYFLETARLDLDNTHGNTKDGLHLANMGGTWMAIVFGFAGLRLKESGLILNPVIPKEWDSYTFNIVFQGRRLKITVEQEKILISLLNGEDLIIRLYEDSLTIAKGKLCEIIPKKNIR